MGEPGTMEVRCKECGFSEVVTPDDDRLSAGVLLEDGVQTGHSLTPVHVQ